MKNRIDELITILRIILICIVWLIGLNYLYNIVFHSPTTCLDNDNITQPCIDYRMDQCRKTEKYTDEICAILVSKCQIKKN